MGKISQAVFERNTLKNHFYYNDEALTEEQKKFKHQIIKKAKSLLEKGYTSEYVKLMLETERAEDPYNTKIKDSILTVVKKGSKTHKQIFIFKEEMIRIIHCLKTKIQNTQKVFENYDLNDKEKRELEYLMKSDEKLVKKILDKRNWR